MTLKDKLHITSREFFQTQFFAYLILAVAETIKKGMVSNFFNMNYLLAVILILGVIMVATEKEEKIKSFKRIAKEKLEDIEIINLKKYK